MKIFYISFKSDNLFNQIKSSLPVKYTIQRNEKIITSDLIIANFSEYNLIDINKLQLAKNNNIPIILICDKKIILKDLHYQSFILYDKSRIQETLIEELLYEILETKIKTVKTEIKTVENQVELLSKENEYLGSILNILNDIEEKNDKFYNHFKTLINNLKSDIKPIQENLPFDYKSHKYKQQLPQFLKIGNLLGVSNNNYPALIPLQDITGLAFKLNDTNREEIHLAIQDFVIQMIENSKEGLIEVSVIDTVKMGANFNLLRNLKKEVLTDFIANELHLKDFIANQFDKSISIISECLSNFSSLYDYNNNSGEIQPFRIIVIADFPNFEGIEKLNTLIRNAKEAGIFFFISYSNDFDLSKSKSKVVYEILKKFILLSEYGNPANDLYGKVIEDNNCVLGYLHKEVEALNLIFDDKIDETIKLIIKDDYSLRRKTKEEIKKHALNIIEQILKKYAIINSKYKLQLDRVNISPEKLNDRISRLSQKSDVIIENYIKGIKIPIGKKAGKTFYFTFGFKSDNYHAIIGGQSGKGKTVLLNNIVARGIEKYTKDELKFAIIDCSGTGFYEFENSNSMEFLTRSTNVDDCFNSIEKLEVEMGKREDLFQRNGVSDIEQYVNKTNNSLNRLIVLIDEFHVLYTGSYKQVAYFDKVLIDKIIRIGRKFGIHLIVSTQSLGGGVRRSILDNIPLRIALGMTNDQSNSFLGMKNDAATNLERGVAIYNHQNGSISANNKIKVNLIEINDINRILSLK